MRLGSIWAIGIAMLWTAGAQASPIFYTATDIADTNAGDDLWRYDYKVANANTGIDVDSFAIYFDLDDYDFNLVSTPSGDEVDANDYSAPAGWDTESFVAPDDDFLFADGFFLIARDFFDPIEEILEEDAISGFSVTFIWRGAGDPGSQYFDYLDTNLDFAGDGFTELMPMDPQPVPEPGTAALVGLGLFALLARRRTLGTV